MREFSHVDQALAYTLKSQAIAGNSSSSVQCKINHTLAGLAGIYLQKSEFDLALGYYQKSLHIHLFTTGEDNSDVATCYHQMAHAYFEHGF